MNNNKKLMYFFETQIKLNFLILPVIFFMGCKNSSLKDTESKDGNNIKTINSIDFNAEKRLLDTVWLNEDYLLNDNFNLSELDMSEFDEKYVIVTLQNANLKEIPSFLRELRGVNSLWIQGGNIPDFGNTLENFNSLEELVINDLQLEQFPDLSPEAPLSLINMDHNLIKVLPEEICKFKNLKAIGIRDNRIVEIPNCICGLRNLTGLALNSNIITRIPECLFYIPNLRFLWVPDNSVEQINLDFQKINDSLRINLVGNPWQMSNLERIIRNNDSIGDHQFMQ